MHRPQTDGYDTERIAELAAIRYSFRKMYVENTAEIPVMFGSVPLVHLPQKAAPYIEHASLSDPNIKVVEDFITTIWPEMAAQCGELLTSIALMDDTNHPLNPNMSGCSCGNTTNFGGICTTIQGVIGFSHGIVHELGHWKMHAMGVHLEDWDNLIANTFDELFESPIRKDKPRPMGACIQAQYSYLHVLELEIRAAKAGRTSDMLSLNVQRMAAGRETLKSWKPDQNGVAFAAALDSWTAELLEEAIPFI